MKSIIPVNRRLTQLGVSLCTRSHGERRYCRPYDTNPPQHDGIAPGLWRNFPRLVDEYLTRSSVYLVVSRRSPGRTSCIRVHDRVVVALYEADLPLAHTFLAIAGKILD